MKTIKFKLFSIFVICTAVVISMGLFPFKAVGGVKADVDHVEEISLSNSDFNSSPTSTVLDKNPSGWSKLESNSLALAGIINVSKDSFANNATSYGLDKLTNPETMSSSEIYDNKILMINGKDIPTTQGFKSQDVSLSSYSYYKFSVILKCQNSAQASIYLKGAEDLADNELNTKFEKVVKNEWTEYTFYIQTGIKTTNVHLELWLGTDGNSNVASSGSSFFDHIKVYRYSKTLFDNEISTENQSTSKLIKLTDRTITGQVQNASFESRNLIGNWDSVLTLPLNTNAKVISLLTGDEIKALGYSEIGRFPKENNANALILESKEKTSFGVKSTKFNIENHGFYKITVRAKANNLSGGAYLKFVEDDDILKFYGEDSETMKFYETKSVTSSSLSSNPDNKFTNNYAEMSLLVKGHPLYDTKGHIELWLGSEENLTTGLVAFDEVTIEKLTSEEFSGFSKGSYDAELALTTLSKETTIKNGAFNLAESADLDGNILPSSFTFERENESISKSGIVNTHTPYYDRVKSAYGNIGNPQNPNPAILTGIDVNNVLMMQNSSKTYQSMTSETFTIEKNAYYELSFDYKTISIDPYALANLKVQVIDESDIVLYESTLESQLWKNKKMYFKTNVSASTVKIKYIFGEEENKQSGYVVLDNLDFKTITETIYNATDADSKSDLSNYMMGLTALKDVITESPAYTSSSTTDLNSGKAGLFNGNDNVYGIEFDGPVVGVHTNQNTTYNLESKFKLKLETGKYYKVTFKLKTNLPEIEYKEEDKITYGAGLELSGLELGFKDLKSNDIFNTFTLFIKANSDVNSTIKYLLHSGSMETAGDAYFTNFTFEETTDSKYREAKDMDVETILTTITTDGADDGDPETPAGPAADFNWLLIPSLILSFALIFAIIGFTVRHIKWKKRVKQIETEYDRNSTGREINRVEAEKIRNEEINILKRELAENESEINAFEEEHKNNLDEQRTQDLSQKQIEKSFKEYANRHTRMQVRIDSIKQKMEELQSDEYLIALSKKLAIENEKRKKKISKQKTEEDLRKDLLNKRK